MRTLIRLILVAVVVVAVGALALGWRAGRSVARPVGDERPLGTSGDIDGNRARERAREIGADAGERAAVAAGRAREELTEAGITSRIKAKMALDKLVRAGAIDVHTRGATVTLSGRGGSQAEKDRAERLAAETSGVSRVVNRLEIAR